MSLRIATVEFLNALPFLTVLRKLHGNGEVELVEAIPSECARLLRDDAVDVALLPVGALDQFERLEIVSRFCIGCVGPVRTVKLFSSVPVDQIKQVVLDPASRSSNQLVRILLRQLWKNETPELVYPDKARPMTQTAYVYIGDKVFGLENQFPHEYDLGEAWKQWTGLPFVFALWVSKSGLPEPVILKLDLAFQEGLDQLEHTILDMDPPLDERIGLSYFSESISYPLDAEKIRGLKKFLQLAEYPEVLHFTPYLKF